MTKRGVKMKRLKLLKNSFLSLLNKISLTETQSGYACHVNRETSDEIVSRATYVVVGGGAILSFSKLNMRVALGGGQL